MEIYSYESLPQLVEVSLLQKREKCEDSWRRWSGYVDCRWSGVEWRHGGGREDDKRMNLYTRMQKLLLSRVLYHVLKPLPRSLVLVAVEAVKSDWLRSRYAVRTNAPPSAWYGVGILDLELLFRKLTKKKTSFSNICTLMFSRFQCQYLI